jgi:hypothetical protein
MFVREILGNYLLGAKKAFLLDDAVLYQLCENIISE